jgi:hypothetical protein
VQSEKEKLMEEKAKQTSETLATQNLLQKQHIPLEQVEALKKSLNSTIENLTEELKNKQRCYEKEQQTVSKLQQLLQNQKNSSVPLTEHLQIKEAFEKEVGLMKASLRQKEEESQSKTEEVSKLQTEVQNTKQALKKLETREVVDLSKYKATKSDLETQISNLNEKLANLNRKYDEACEEVLHAKKKKLSAKDEKGSLHLSIEQEIEDQKERCDKSLTTITELQKKIQESAKQLEVKDRKVGMKLSVHCLQKPQNRAASALGQYPTDWFTEEQSVTFWSDHRCAKGSELKSIFSSVPSAGTAKSQRKMGETKVHLPHR